MQDLTPPARTPAAFCGAAFGVWTDESTSGASDPRGRGREARGHDRLRRELHMATTEKSTRVLASYPEVSRRSADGRWPTTRPRPPAPAGSCSPRSCSDSPASGPSSKASWRSARRGSTWPTPPSCSAISRRGAGSCSCSASWRCSPPSRSSPAASSPAGSASRVAGLNALGQLMFIQANPWWSVAMFTVCLLVIYGLAAYGGSRLRTD